MSLMDPGRFPQGLDGSSKHVSGTCDAQSVRPGLGGWGGWGVGKEGHSELLLSELDTGFWRLVTCKRTMTWSHLQ